MASYVVIRVRTNDPGKLKDYQQVAPSIIEKYSGKFLARGGEIVTLEGPEENRRIIIIEFPGLKEAKEFYNSHEYQNAIKLRSGVAEFELIAIDGVAE